MYNKLYDFEARYYDPIFGFTTMDPLCEKYYGVNPYSYCAGNPVNRIVPDGRDWIVANGKTNYRWRDDISAKSKMPEDYTYVGANDADILIRLGMNNTFPELSTNDIGMVAADAELGKYAASHFVNVKEKVMQLSLHVSFPFIGQF